MRGMQSGTAVITAALTLAACSEKDNSEPLPAVIDRFEVGRGIYVRSLSVDEATNTLWVGSSVGAMEIDTVTRDLRNSFTRADGLANEYIFAIDVDSRGYTWFGTNAGGTSRYKDGEWQTYFPMHGLADYWIYAFAEQSPRRYWIGTWAGANRVDLDDMSFITIKDELINEWVYGIDVDSADRVWFGTEGGVSMLDGEQWQHWTHEDGVGSSNIEQLPASRNTGLGTRSRHDLSVVVDGRESYNPNYVFAILSDSNDDIWAGTWGGGIAHFDGRTWSNFTMEDGLAGNIVYSVVQDKHGAYWFGTNNGLSRFDGSAWNNYGTDDGLLGQHVYAIAIGTINDIWVGTQNGVTLLSVTPSTNGQQE